MTAELKYENPKLSQISISKRNDALQFLQIISTGAGPTERKTRRSADQLPTSAIVILESQNIHGAKELSEHDCICLLLGKGKPKKILYENK